MELFKEMFFESIGFYEAQEDLCKAQLKDIVCSTLVIHGEADKVTSRQHPVFIAENIKNAKLRFIPDGPHHVHMKFPELFNSLAFDFLLN